MVVTKMDTLSSAHYGYGSETTIFDHIAKTMNDKRVPLSQVLMVANEFHRRSLGPDGEPGGLPDPSLVCERLNLARDDSGQPVLPSGFAKYPELLSAFQEVMCDGGIGRLREVIGERLAEAVEGEVRDEVEGRLKSIRNRLAKLVSSARDAAQMNDGSFETAVDWKVGLQMVIQDLDEDRAMLEAPATAMAEVLSKKFEATCPARLKIEVEKLRAAHNDYVIVLEKTLRHECKSTFLPQVHDRVSDRLRTLEAQHGKVRLEDRASPTEVWEDRRLADEQSLVCLTASGAGFKLPLLFPGAEPAPLDANQYRALMPRKIRLISHRVAFVVGQRVRGHLNEMIEGLTFLKNAEGHLDAADTAPYDEVLGSLE